VTCRDYQTPGRTKRSSSTVAAHLTRLSCPAGHRPAAAVCVGCHCRRWFGLTSSATWLFQIQRLWADRHPC